jgi:MFS family permease
MALFSLKTAVFRLRRSFANLAVGGDWALGLPDKMKENLRWFWYDGLFASASDNIVLTYLVLFLLALGATRTQIGLLSSFSSLAAALFLLPGAFLVERFGLRKWNVVIFGGGIARLAILAIALFPLILGGQTLIWAVIALSVSREAFGNLSFPAWMSITGDMVPMEGRGRYFGSRNFIMGLAGMVTVLLVGEWITRSEQPLGYQISFGAAFLIGMISTYSFAHLNDPFVQASKMRGASLAPSKLLREIMQNPPFLVFCVSAALWNFSINIAGPFFNVFMVEGLQATATMVGVASIFTSLFNLAVQRRSGALIDRWGPRRVQTFSMLLIPLVPLVWAFIHTMWQVYLANILAGILWGAFGLASFNVLLSLIPEAQRARLSAFYQILVTVSLAGGAALGSWVITQWGYKGVFIGSAIGRMISALGFAWFFLKPTRGVAQAVENAETEIAHGS